MPNKILIIIIVIAAFLRIWKIDQVPVSLFGDELDVGYHAYSILKTGKDYSGNFMPLHFQSLAEWRTPLYLYSAVPTVALFGISPLGVRLPAAIFGILGVWVFYLLVKELIPKNPRPYSISYMPLLAALLLAISPWHIQYSRAGFEVTQMLALFLAGLWLFLKGLRDGRWLPLSTACLALTPWAYSTAKLFTPLAILAIVLIWRKELLSVTGKWLVWSIIVLFVVGGPIAYSTVFGGGTARFAYLSIFTDPTTIPQVGWDRLRDAKVRDPNVEFGVQPSIIDRAFHNKILSWWNIFIRNYLQVFSTQFLFIQGDLNLRHSPNEMGQLYRIELIFLLAGIAFFLTSAVNLKIKALIIFWLLAAPIPSVLTRDGGMHATRLFFMLPVLIFLISFGIYNIWQKASLKYKKLVVFGITLVYLFSFILYQHSYWVHYPWESERWWHAGFKEAIQTAKQLEGSYDRIIITMASEPAWIFFAGWYEYSPEQWHKKYPFQKTSVSGFGDISYIDKYHFGSPSLKSGIYSLSEFLDTKTLYIASAKEFNLNFIQEPERLPKNLRMLKAVSYPSGEPVFYLLSFNPQEKIQ